MDTIMEIMNMIKIMKKDMMSMKEKMKNTMKMHPFSTVLFAIYFATSVLQGSIELFLVGFLAASAAYVLEFLFYVTGMIRTGRNCAGSPRSVGVQSRQKQGSAA